jgi:hypothetical protein
MIRDFPLGEKNRINLHFPIFFKRSTVLFLMFHGVKRGRLGQIFRPFPPLSGIAHVFRNGGGMRGRNDPLGRGKAPTVSGRGLGYSKGLPFACLLTC